MFSRHLLSLAPFCLVHFLGFEVLVPFVFLMILDLFLFPFFFDCFLVFGLFLLPLFFDFFMFFFLPFLFSFLFPPDLFLFFDFLNCFLALPDFLFFSDLLFPFTFTDFLLFFGVLDFFFLLLDFLFLTDFLRLFSGFAFGFLMCRFKLCSSLFVFTRSFSPDSSAVTKTTHKRKQKIRKEIRYIFNLS